MTRTFSIATARLVEICRQRTPAGSEKSSTFLCSCPSLFPTAKFVITKSFRLKVFSLHVWRLVATYNIFSAPLGGAEKMLNFKLQLNFLFLAPNACHRMFESRWNLQGCPKLANRSQPLVGRSSPYYEDMWERYRCLTSFFPDCRHMPQLRRYSPTKLCDGAKMAIFLHPVFSASRMQHISDLHSKFALRPHHVWKYGRHPISDRWD